MARIISALPGDPAEMAASGYNVSDHIWGNGGGPTRSAYENAYSTDANGYRTGKQYSAIERGFGANQHGRDEGIRTDNAQQAAMNFYGRLPGGKRSSDPYEAAQQDRNMYLDKDRLKYAGARSPDQLLQDRMGTEAYDFRKGLPELMANQRDALTHQAGSALDQGLHNTRANMSSRGLLNSGLRENAEGSMRGRAANQLAGQMAGSNAELSKMADSRDFSAAQANLQASQMAMQAQQQADDIHMQNEIRRAQMWQQLGQGVGEIGGAAYGYNRRPNGNGGAA